MTGKKPKIIRDQLKVEIINEIWTLFETEEKKEDRKKKKQNERIIKGRIIRDIRTLFEQEKVYFYKLKRVSNFWNNNYIEYESNGDKNRNLSLYEYLNKIEPYLRNVIIDLQNFDALKFS